MIDRIGGQIPPPIPERVADRPQDKRESKPTASAQEILSRLLDVQVQGTQRKTVGSTESKRSAEEFAPHLGRFLDVMA